jgi:hypothetical protein
MEKLIKILFISLYIYCLSGYSFLYAHSSQDCNDTSSIENLEILLANSLDFQAQTSLTTLEAKLPTPKKENNPFESFLIKEEKEEKEKEKDFSFDKNPKNHFFTLPSYDLILGDLYQYDKNHPPSSKNFNHFISYKLYILIQVFRI